MRSKSSKKSKLWPKFLTGLFTDSSDSLWVQKFAWLPKRCCISNKLIWLKYGLCSTMQCKNKLHTESKHKTLWVDPYEFVIESLKGTVNV